MGEVVLDANVVIGLFEPSNAHHGSVRAALAAARSHADVFSLPASVLSEAMVGAYRAGTANDRRQRIVALFGPVRPVDEEVALAAAELRARHRSLRLPDALVIAIGVVDDAIVLTCDKRMESVDSRVQLISPD